MDEWNQWQGFLGKGLSYLSVCLGKSCSRGWDEMGWDWLVGKGGEGNGKRKGKRKEREREEGGKEKERKKKGKGIACVEVLGTWDGVGGVVDILS